jgi:hypothetical protein
MVKMHTFKITPTSVLWALEWFNHTGIKNLKKKKRRKGTLEASTHHLAGQTSLHQPCQLLTSQLE